MHKETAKAGQSQAGATAQIEPNTIMVYDVLLATSYPISAASDNTHEKTAAESFLKRAQTHKKEAEFKIPCYRSELAALLNHGYTAFAVVANHNDTLHEQNHVDTLLILNQFMEMNEGPDFATHVISLHNAKALLNNIKELEERMKADPEQSETWLQGSLPEDPSENQSETGEPFWVPLFIRTSDLQSEAGRQRWEDAIKAAHTFYQIGSLDMLLAAVADPSMEGVGKQAEDRYKKVTMPAQDSQFFEKIFAEDFRRDGLNILNR